MNIMPQVSRNLAALFLAISLFGVGNHLFAQEHPAPAAQAAAGGAPRAADADRITALGSLEPQETIRVSAEIGGAITKWMADTGDVVKAGELLATIDARSCEIKLQQAQGKVAAAQAALARAKADLEFASMSNQRAEMSFKSGALGASEFDVIRHQREVALIAVELAEAEIKVQQAGLEEAELQVGKTKIISPVDGTIVDRRVAVGQTVNAGASDQGLFVIASDLSRLKVRIAVPASRIRKVAQGQTVHVTVEGIHHAFDAKVTRIQFNADALQTGTFNVIALIDNSQHELMPYTTANAQIDIVPSVGEQK